MHICVGDLTIIGSDNGLLPGRRQANIWTNAGILLIQPLGTNFSEILIKIHTFSFKKMHLKMSSGKCRTFCLGLNVLKKLLGTLWDQGTGCWLDDHLIKGSHILWQIQTTQISYHMTIYHGKHWFMSGPCFCSCVKEWIYSLNVYENKQIIKWAMVIFFVW